MALTDLEALERRVRTRYEWQRALRSVVGFSPVLLVIALAALTGRRPQASMTFGALLFMCGVLFLWRGQSLRRAVFWGVMTGLVPLGMALLANRGHGCAGGHCSNWCLPACVLGGVIGGTAVSWGARRQGLGWPFWAGATAMTLLTGAMGCACIGSAGVVGLCLGYLAAAAPWGLIRWAQP